ncbi:hypothetical protein SAMN05444920_1444 [Nonomuraea solani]|uniref:Uncharacterized protein n=1 Tax=Nonomuraea solani TaxID=1144553 RepID=A0A1H6F416_9ACTN|nr:hypothetical protein [Nonomuraea solani]SEH03785.1 hypothetical protein SAMN05444920_1444 [Nonomuraea solani]
MRTLAVCQGCLVDKARAIAYVNRHVARGSGDVLGVLSRNIIPAIDAEIGIDGRGPSVPGSTHIRPAMRASFITTLYANSRRRQQMIDEGYALGMELFSRWAAADEPKEREA